MLSKVLIANRGAISVRIQRTLKRMGITSVAVYSDADRSSLHVSGADEAVALGGNRAAENYLDIARIIQAARDCGADGIHPGYGFLSENLEFAAACEQAGIAFIGPTREQIEEFGLKHTARQLAEASGIPMLSGTGLLVSQDEACRAAHRIGYPVMLKSTAGGGGIGMQRCFSEDELRRAWASVKRLSQNNFSNDGLFLEKFVQRARHIEVQIFGDGRGKVVALGERDCSPQRRNQKVVEETPAPNLPATVRDAMHQAAVRLGESVSYRNAGTVEFIYDDEAEQFYFLEVNTRLQVEHGVTEEVTGVDLVEWMVRLAGGERDFLDQPVPEPQGHAIQVRLYAEDPGRQFQPCVGLLTEVSWPEDARCDTWVERGLEVSPFYDPMLAKVIVHADDREAAIGKLQAALASTRVSGFETNLDYLRAVVADPVFFSGRQTTAWLDSFAFSQRALEVLSAGTMTTVQDFPGRVGYWDVGVPPSGPFDSLALRLGNRLLGNEPGAAALEMTMNGARLRLRDDLKVVLAGAGMNARCGDMELEPWTVYELSAGAEIVCGQVSGAGVRAYLCVAGGLQVPDYLGSASTFTLGRFGGHGGRALQPGDVLHVGPQQGETTASLPAALRPEYRHHWELRVMYGPHGAPDFFTTDDIDTFFSTDWEVHYNSSRTGVRLIGPKPAWAREDGGEAGLHPSNIHDNAYAIGAVDFTGDMPVILGPDGPSLGGFVCPVTLIKADLWCLGQLRAGDTIRFVPVTAEAAEQAERAQLDMLASLSAGKQLTAAPVRPDTAVLHDLPATGERPQVVWRPAGDDNLLVEYGPQELDLRLRFRVQALMDWLRANPLPGLLELTPGIRSLQIHFDNLTLPRNRLMALLEQAEEALGDSDSLTVPTRTVHMPLSWDDPQCQLAVDKYMQSVRKDAPWCPSNLEFIRRINGLDSIDEVKRIVFDASYLVMGLGDVYLGAPVATPLDPRHRLVTTKYNPARTWTPENAVGIGGAYLCVYGMEGPGGYQFVGRTVQVWNTWRTGGSFRDDKPWLLRFFDQIRFYEVSHDELMQMREDFPRGRMQLKIEEGEFSLSDYNAFLQREAEDIAGFRQRQRQAFAEERERWRAAGQDLLAHAEEPVADHDEVQLEAHQVAVLANVPGSIWQVSVEVGDTVAAGDTVAVLEAMKMEIPVVSDAAGVVERILVSAGQSASAGQTLLVLSAEGHS